MNLMEFEQAKRDIGDQVPLAELLALLAEEAVELSHAALKLRRACDGSNPTPVHTNQALDNLMEEIADVRLLNQILGVEYLHIDIQRRMEEKLTRWQNRLKEREEPKQ